MLDGESDDQEAMTAKNWRIFQTRIEAITNK